jgi:hypothetical protein
MSDILHTLIEAFRGRLSQDCAPAVLCGDPLGNAAAMALQGLGMNLQPYAITYDDASIDEIVAIADRLDRELKLISIAAKSMGTDFVHLAVQHRCFAKAQFALGYVAMHASEAVDETEVWLSLPRSSPDNRGWRTATRIAGHYGKTLFNPYHGLDFLVDVEVDSVKRVATETIGVDQDL